MANDPKLTLIITSERTFATDRTTLFRTFSNPELLEKWWGPHGFTNRIELFDLRDGGTFRVVMTSSSNTDFGNEWTFEEIQPDARIVAFHHGPMHVFRLDMQYEDAADGTRLTWRMSFEDTQHNRDIEKFLAAANQQNFDRLETLITDLKKDD